MRIALFPRTMLDIVEERLLAAGSHVRVGGEVKTRGEERMRAEPLRGPMQQVVHERGHARCAGLRDLCEIAVSVEQRSGAAPLAPKAQVMHQRVHAGSAGLGAPVEVKRRVEQRVWAAALPSAVKDVVRKRIAAGARKVGIAAYIMRATEQRVRIATLTKPVLEVVRNRVLPSRGHVRVSREVPLRVDQGSDFANHRTTPYQLSDVFREALGCGIL